MQNAKTKKRRLRRFRKPIRIFSINDNEDSMYKRGFINRRWVFHSTRPDGHRELGHIELQLFSRSIDHFSLRTEFSKQYESEHTILFSIVIPYVVSFYVCINSKWLEKRKWYSKWLKEDETIVKYSWGSGMKQYASPRILYFNVYCEFININLFSLGDERSNKKWQCISFDWKKFLLGDMTIKTEVLRKERVEVPMPEKDYEAECVVTRIIRKRPRWFTDTYLRGEINCKEGIPVPGKGTESYNCGEDCCYSISFPLKEWELDKAVSTLIGKMVSDVYYKRKKYPL